MLLGCSRNAPLWVEKEERGLSFGCQSRALKRKALVARGPLITLPPTPPPKFHSVELWMSRILGGEGQTRSVVTLKGLGWPVNSRISALSSILK